MMTNVSEEAITTQERRSTVFKKATLILVPLLILMTLLGAGHLAAQTTSPSDPPLIRLQVATFDPLVGEPDIPDGQRLTIQADRPTTYLVQFTGPVHNEWKAAVEKAGVRLYGYIPDYAFIARMDPATAESVRGLSFVRWVGLYHPAYRLSPDLSGTAIGDSGSISVTVQTLPGADLDALAAQVEAWDGKVQGRATNAIAGYLRASLTTDWLTGLAALDGVLWVEPYFEPHLLNDVAGGQIMRAGEIRSGMGLRGSGQIVAVADTGLDTGDLNTLHPDVRGRVIQTDCLGRPDPCDWSDYGGHGTHVAGSVLGDGSVSGGTYAGTAPQAQLVFQSVGDALGRLTGIPEDKGDLMRDAYDYGARIHTNSWGAPTGPEENPYGGYNTASHQVDQAMWEHKDQFVLFGAGNEATNRDGDGVVDLDSVLSPGTAKNVLTVGASESDRGSIPFVWGPESKWGDPWGEPIASDRRADNPDGMAAFSSRGPTDDGRVKPDIVAPGTFIASMRTYQYVFDDDMEGDTSGYLQASFQGGTVFWQLLTDDPHSSSHYRKQTVNGTYNAGATTALFTRPMNVMPAGDFFDIYFWHKYTLGGNDQVRVVLLAPDISDPGLLRARAFPLNVSGTQGTYTTMHRPFKVSTLIQLGFNPTELRIGFEIFSPDATYNSTWSLDDIRVDGSDWGTMSSVGLAQPGEAVDEAYVMMGGTSMATPLTAGAAALVREWLTTIRDIADPSAALMKAVFINGAADISPGQYGTGGSREIPALRPNNVTGWGRVDLVESLDPPDPHSLWLEDNTAGLSTGGSAVYTLTVGASQSLGVPAQQADGQGWTSRGSLRITLGWTDYPAEPLAAKALVNDLDLEVLAPDGTHHYGNRDLYHGGNPCLRGGQWDACNNIEGVIIPSASDGAYTVIVRGHNVASGGSQPFALVASGDNLREEVVEPGLETTVYLPIVLKNYDPDELLQNRTFDTGTWAPWQTVGSPDLTDQVYHSARWSARLAGYNYAVDYVYQEVTVPSNATEVTLDFWCRVSGNDPDPEEVLCYEIVDSEITHVFAGECQSVYLMPENQWLNLQLVVSGTDLTPLLGQTVLVAFDVFTNATNPSTAWVDDVSFKVTRAGP